MLSTGTDYYKPAKLNDYKNVMGTDFAVPKEVWKENHTVISNANVILNRLTNASQVNDEDKKVIRGEALVFRGYAYRMLANLFGGVPLIPGRNHDSSPATMYGQAGKKFISKSNKIWKKPFLCFLISNR
ncbi:MAG: RagB/SusD family nutrient uptake outer membrane protein [Parabacteroides merdae]